MELGNIHGNWYPNKQPRGLLFLGYPLEIKDANGQFPFSAGISWLVMFDTTGGYAGLWLILAFINIIMFIIVCPLLLLIICIYLLHLLNTLVFLSCNCYRSARAQCFVGSQLSEVGTCRGAPPALRSAQGTIGGNHKGLLGVPLPSLQPGAMAISPTWLVISWELMGFYAENRWYFMEKILESNGIWWWWKTGLNTKLHGNSRG